MKILAAKPLDHFRLHLRFDDGVAGVVDLGSPAGRGVFQAWEQPGVFEPVVVTSVGAMEWPGQIDLCPDALYLQVTGKTPEEIFPALCQGFSHA